jgi:hypothetical protein
MKIQELAFFIQEQAREKMISQSKAEPLDHRGGKNLTGIGRLPP